MLVKNLIVSGASSNGRTRDFGSLYHGSNPCAPTKNLNAHRGVLIFACARIGQSATGTHDQYADEQLATAQKRIFLIEFLPCGWLLFIKVSCAFQRVYSVSCRFNFGFRARLICFLLQPYIFLV